MDRETITLVATIVAVVGVIFLFREMNKAKQEVEGLKNFSAHVMHRLNAPIRIIEPEPEPEPVLEKSAEEKKEE